MIKSKWIPAKVAFEVLGLVLGPGALAQVSEQDCLGAIPVCQWQYSTSNAYLGSGANAQEINPSISCLGGGELNSVWYSFNIQTSGNLSFTIHPHIATNDYDWAVYNLTNATCADIYNNPALQVSCNFIGTPGPTGANGGPPPQNNPVIPVQAGETYVLVVSVYPNPNNGVQGGYLIDFSASTAQVFDNQPPTLQSVDLPVACSADSLVLHFSEKVNCNQLSPSTFYLTGPNGAVNILSVKSYECLAGAPFSKTVVLKVAPAFTASGNYTLSLASSLSDQCGNYASAATAVPLSFAVNSLQLDSSWVIPTDCNSPTGEAGVLVSQGVPPYIFTWVPSVSSSNVASNLPAGNYSVTISDQQGCSITQNFQVQENIPFTISLSQTPDTCSQGKGTATVTTQGSSLTFTYQWDDPLGQTTPTATGLMAYNDYVVTVTDENGCELTGQIVVQNYINPNLIASFEAEPDSVDLLFPTCKLINTSQGFSSYKWELLGRVITDTLNPVIEFTTYGIFDVFLTVYDDLGCQSTAYRPIKVYALLHFYMPNAFTPNDNDINEVWRPVGIGFDTTTYHLWVFDRWGHLVFETQDYKTSWNGTDLKGKPAPQGLYAVRVTMKDIYGLPRQFLGSVYLYR
ncbi:MAG: gliding motility-associated C-terminal domain-containing protein [Flavobacteriales bacterium]|nr:gliding motility-associated C-terminal domain-containing protein [Flavobacteriales bacterium]